LLLNSALEFAVHRIVDGRGDKIDELPYLRIKREIADQLTGIVAMNPEKTGYSAFEIDDFLLGHLEDVGWYMQRKLIRSAAAYASFGYYVINTLENPEMKKFLEDQRTHKFTYDHADWLYRRLRNWRLSN
jgi:hypothetical protein